MKNKFKKVVAMTMAAAMVTSIMATSALATVVYDIDNGDVYVEAGTGEHEGTAASWQDFGEAGRSETVYDNDIVITNDTSYYTESPATENSPAVEVVTASDVSVYTDENPAPTDSTPDNNTVTVSGNVDVNITLGSDITTTGYKTDNGTYAVNTVTVKDGADVTLDLNGHDINSWGYGVIASGTNTTVEVKDGDVNSKYLNSIGALNGADVALDDVDVTAGRYGVYADGKGTSVELNKSDVSGGTAGIRAQSSADVDMTGGTVKSDNNYGVVVFTDADVSLNNVDVTAGQWGVYVDGKGTTAELNGGSVYGCTNSDGSKNRGAVDVRNGAELTIKGTTVVGTETGVAVSNDNSKLTISERATITGKKYFGVAGNGSEDSDGSLQENTIIIDNAVITGYTGIYHPQGGTLTITNSNVTGTAGTAVEIRAGELVINGGTYASKAENFSCDANGNGTTTQGAAIAIAQHTTKKDIQVTIINGTFEGVKALNESNPQGNTPEPQVTLKVQGGTFNGGFSVTDDDAVTISGGKFKDVSAKKYLANEKLFCEHVSGDSYVLMYHGMETNPAVENTVDAQIGVPGSYDAVLYCACCGKEISRGTYTIAALPYPEIEIEPEVEEIETTAGTTTEVEIEENQTPLAGLPEIIPDPAELENTFEDVAEEAEYRDAVVLVAELGLMDAAEDGAFAPEEAATCDVVMEALFRMDGTEHETVADWAADNGMTEIEEVAAIVEALDEGKEITRAELATIVYCFVTGKVDAESIGDLAEIDLTGFADIDEDDLGAYVAEAVKWAVSNGYLSTDEAGMLNLSQTVTRAEVAVLLARIMESMVGA